MAHVGVRAIQSVLAVLRLRGRCLPIVTPGRLTARSSEQKLAVWAHFYFEIADTFEDEKTMTPELMGEFPND